MPVSLSVRNDGNQDAKEENCPRKRTNQVTNDVKSQIVEPMQTVHINPLPLSFVGSIAPAVPLFDQLGERVLYIRLELGDAFHAKGMRHCLAFASVLGAIAGVEEASLDGDEGVVILAERKREVSQDLCFSATWLKRV